MQLDMFIITVQPILLYACEVWGHVKFDVLERFFLSYLKSILYVKKSTPNCFVYGELGVFPLYIEQRIRIIKYWLKLIKPADSKPNFAQRVYKEMLILQSTQPNPSTWVTQVKDILEKCGLGNFWKNQVINDECSFISLFKQRVYDIFQQEWMGEVNLTSDYRLFQHVRDSYFSKNI